MLHFGVEFALQNQGLQQQLMLLLRLTEQRLNTRLGAEPIEQPLLQTHADG